MKKITSIFTALLLIVSVAQATIRTVSNFPANVAQFNDIQSAINAANNGDTIMVHGSPNNYNGFSLNKRIVLIGPGFNPDKIQFPFTVRLGGPVDIFLDPGSAFSEIQGIVFSARVVYTYATNMKFIRNEFNSGSGIYFEVSNSTGHVVEGNYFNAAGVYFHSGASFSNLTIQNNVFRDGAISGFFNGTNILVNHNLFYGSTPGTTNLAFNAALTGGSRFVTIANNIFVNSDASQVTNSSFTNNITFNSGNNAPWNLNSNMNVAGNVENQNPQMADQAIVNAGTSNPLGNFTIAAGPANNTGSDGKDMGLLYDITGALNWTKSRMPRLPFISIMNVTTPTVAAGGTLQVNIEARTNN